MAVPKRSNGHSPAPLPAVAPRGDTPREIRTGAARSRGEATIKQEAARMTTTTSAYGRETAQDEHMGTVQFERREEPAFVRVGAGKTINLGNFESLRIDVAVTYPCLPADIEQTFETAANFVAEKLIAEESAWLGGNAPAPSTPPSTKHKASRR